MGCEATERWPFTMQAVERAVKKLHGDKLLLSARTERSRSCRDINQCPDLLSKFAILIAWYTRHFRPEK